MRRLVSVSSGPSVSELRLWELNLEIMSRDEQYLFHAIFIYFFSQPATYYNPLSSVVCGL